MVLVHVYGWLGGGGGGGGGGMISVKITQWCLRLIRVYAIYILVYMVFYIWVYGIFIWDWSFHLGMVFIWP